MKHKIVCLILLICLASCAGFIKLSPQDKLKVTCEDMLTQYEKLYNQSLAITSNENTSEETKKYVITKINPNLNKAKPLILEYCDGAANKDQITVILGNIITLYTGVPK